MKSFLVAAALAAGAGSALAAQYQILIYESSTELAKRTDAGAAGQAYWDAYQAYGAALQSAGVLRGGAALHGNGEARAVMSKDGRPTVAARPVASSAAQLGGFFLIEVADLDAAIGWAARSPSFATGGAAEVRPLYAVPAMTTPR